MTSPLSIPRKVADTDDLDHYVCCDENRALCGADLTDVPWKEDLPNLCIVCADLDEFDCERCGE